MSKKFAKPKGILMDVEGTTTDHNFVRNNLFPLVKKNLIQFLEETYETRETKEVIQRLRQTQKDNKIRGVPTIATEGKVQIVKSVHDCILSLLSGKSDESALKQMILLCWLWAYEKGLFKYHVYDDVSYALHVWKTKYRIKLYTFSSAMVCSQWLAFVTTNHGNIYSLIDQFFDGTVGDKTDPKSYRLIAEKIKLDGRDLLFITNSDKEAKAATTVGLKTVRINRTNRASSDVADIPTITSFADIKF